MLYRWAGEMRNPEKNVPRAILGSISIVSVLYMLIIATIAMLGPLCKPVHRYKTHLSK